MLCLLLLLFFQGEKDTTLQFVASKFSAHCFLPLLNDGFTKPLMKTLANGVFTSSAQCLHCSIQDKCSKAIQYSDPQDIIRFTTFLAELFFRIRTEVCDILSVTVMAKISSFTGR